MGAAQGAAAKELHVLNWQGWGTDQPFATAAFEKATGFKVVNDYMTSFPEAFTKLHTSPGYYDIFVVSMAWVRRAIDEGLLDPIDVNKVKNFNDLLTPLRTSDAIQKDGKVYGVPWVWGSVSISYNTEVFAAPPSSVQVLWDAKHAGRLCWHDAVDDSIGFAALATGQDPNNPANLDAVRQKLRDLKPQLKTMWKSEDEWLKLVGSGQCDLSIIWMDSTEKAKTLHKLPINFVVAEEGALGFRDAIAIPKGAPNPDAAYAFIDYMTSPEFYAGWTKAGGAPVAANQVAIKALPEQSMERQVLSDPATVNRIRFKQLQPDDRLKAFTELWEETKAYYAQ